MVKHIFWAALLMFLLAGNALAIEQTEKPPVTLADKHQVGLRLGGWINQGDLPPNFLTDGINSLESSVDDGSFYFEAYFAYRFLPGILGEFSAGIVNRGTVTLDNASSGLTDIGNLQVYPLLIQAKLYPLAGVNSRLQPYVTAGGGLYYGRRGVQITNNYYSSIGLNDETETDFNYVIGGGFDWLLSNSIGLDFNAKYMPINFSDALVLVNDYNAVTITVGVKYLYTGKK